MSARISPIYPATAIFAFDLLGRQTWRYWIEAYDLCIGICAVIAYAYFFLIEEKPARQWWLLGMLAIVLLSFFKEVIVDPTKTYAGEIITAVVILCAVLYLNRKRKI